MLFFYNVECLLCKKIFELDENNSQYKKFKLNMKGKYICNSCKEKIESDARKMML
ncbi:DUF2197 domain-containing protein [Bacillus sp. DJP31]|uniref:DUF2197 domain-containing protein n=1 Tax=Bacillus sp. DJP31 TaxID=3409789 RepID=UPI003BB54F9F